MKKFLALATVTLSIFSWLSCVALADEGKGRESKDTPAVSDSDDWNRTPNDEGKDKDNGYHKGEQKHDHEVSDF